MRAPNLTLPLPLGKMKAETQTAAFGVYYLSAFGCAIKPFPCELVASSDAAARVNESRWFASAFWRGILVFFLKRLP
jgi:hypothetical protein